MNEEQGVNDDDDDSVVKETDSGWQGVESSLSAAALTETLTSRTVNTRRSTACGQITTEEPQQVLHWSEKHELWHLVDAAPKPNPKDIPEVIPDCPSDDISPIASRYFLRRPYRGPLVAGKVSNTWYVLRDEKSRECCVDQGQYCTPCLPPDMSPGERCQAKRANLRDVIEGKQFSKHVDSKLDKK